MALIGSFTFADLVVQHAELNGVSVLTNGLEAMRKFNPVTGSLLPLVLRPFRGSVALTDLGAGNLSAGVYTYRVVPYNINEDEEGQPFPDDSDVAAFQITLTAGRRVRINRAGLSRDDTEVTHWRIYRTIADGVWPVMFRVATVPWATTTYNDNTADPGEDDDAFISEGLDYLIQVPTPKPFLCQHGDRIFGIGDVPYSTGQAGVTNGSRYVTPVGAAVWGFHLERKELHVGTDSRAYIIESWDPDNNRLVLEEEYAGTTDAAADYRICGAAHEMIWCEPDREDQWPGANVRSVGGKEADKPAGIVSDNGRLVVAKSRKLYEVTSSGELWAYPYSRVALLTSEHGGISHRTAAYINEVLTVASKRGIVQIGGESAVLVSQAAQEWFEENLALDADGTQQMAFAVHYAARRQYMLFIKSADATLGCDKALVWQYDTRKFTTFEFLTEFTCGAVVKNSDGEDVVVLGDVNGYVWEYPFGDTDGAPAGSTLTGTVDVFVPGSPCALLDDDAQFPTSGLGLAGIPVYIYEGTGAGQSAVISTNTETALFFNDCFDVELDATSKYHIGPILAEYRTGWMDFGSIGRIKKAVFARLAFEQEPSTVRLNIFKDFNDAEPVDLVDERTSEDKGVVDLDKDNGVERVGLGSIDAYHLAWGLEDDKPNNPVRLYDLGLDIEVKER